MPKKKLRFEGFLATQGKGRQVVMIRALASEIASIASVERLTRDDKGRAIGFQRGQVAAHISEIRGYLEQGDAVLPNALVLAFVENAKIVPGKGPQCFLEVTIDDRPPGYVVDGQQRLTALLQTARKDFQVFASCLLCKSTDELRRQFILINNTKPLKKSFIYELLPGASGLPERYDSRTLAAALTEKLNFSDNSSLRHLVKMETNRAGIIRDTALQKAILNSESAGAIQVLMSKANGVDACQTLLSNYFTAVRQVFPDAWEGQKPTTSRLIHGAGVVAMGYVMDEIYARAHSSSVDTFVAGLQPLVGKTAWTAGKWTFADGEQVPWNRVEFTPRQVQQLAEHLVSVVRQARQPKRAAR